LTRNPSGSKKKGAVKILHILRSEPDETVEKLTVSMNMDNSASVVMLYEDPVDWPALVDKIFENDKVICWW
jgi:hypothetical protein